MKKSAEVDLKHSKDPKAFMEYSNDINDVYNSIEKYNAGKKRKVLIVFDDMIVSIISDKKLRRAVTKLLIRGRKLGISLVLIT